MVAANWDTTLRIAELQGQRVLGANQVDDGSIRLQQLRWKQPHTERKENPLDFLASTSSESEQTGDSQSSSESEPAADSAVRQVQVNDKGSHPQCTRVHMQGVPVYGIIDTGADITFLGVSSLR